jgi:hypothetical protein
VRRPVAAIAADQTCPVGGTAFSVSEAIHRYIERKLRALAKGSVWQFDGDKSPAQSDDKSSHSKVSATVGQVFQPASAGDFPVARFKEHRTGKSGEPAGWKACPTFCRRSIAVRDFGLNRTEGGRLRGAAGRLMLAGP